MIRQPAVEGRFYPYGKDAVFDFINDLENKQDSFSLAGEPGKIIGAVLPHAGHIYSAPQTIPFFQHVNNTRQFPETVVILNPNHTGAGPEIALVSHTAWSNSIGEVAVDNELNELLPYPKENVAQRSEHSAEVLIPYLQYYLENHEFKILPVCIKRATSETAIQLAKDLHQAVRQTGRNIQIIASSDFSHFLTPEEGFRKDQLLLDRMFDKDIKAVENVVIRNRLSVCGYMPIMTLMAYSDLIDPNYSMNILQRGHSGLVYPSREVVDYISILFETTV